MSTAVSKSEQEFYTTSQAAKLAQCSRQHIDAERRAGRLIPYGQRGGKGAWLFEREQLERWMRGDVDMQVMVAQGERP